MSQSLVCFIIFFGLLKTAFANHENVYGKAYDKTGNKILYHEVHEVKVDVKGFTQIIETKFLDPSLKEFATLKSTFKSNPFIPNSELFDKRLKRHETLELDGEQAHLKISIDGKKDEEKIIKINPNFVAGQGFNNFILKNFDDLLKGIDQKISLVVVPLLDFFNFEAKRNGKYSEKESTVDIKIQVASTFLKIFADPISLKYDKKTKHLLEYRGLSNLLNEKGENQQVVIKYSDSPPLTP
jgi:hypothetical protein